MPLVQSGLFPAVVIKISYHNHLLSGSSPGVEATYDSVRQAAAGAINYSSQNHSCMTLRSGERKTWFFANSTQQQRQQNHISFPFFVVFNSFPQLIINRCLFRFDGDNSGNNLQVFVYIVEGDNSGNT